MNGRSARLRTLLLIQRLEAGERVTRRDALLELQQIHDDLIPESDAQARRRNMAAADAKNLPWTDARRRSPADPRTEDR